MTALKQIFFGGAKAERLDADRNNDATEKGHLQSVPSLQETPGSACRFTPAFRTYILMIAVHSGQIE
jgi:hypothetical protein